MGMALRVMSLYKRVPSVAPARVLCSSPWFMLAHPHSMGGQSSLCVPPYM